MKRFANLLRTAPLFFHDEEGAVTVDWIVLAAAVVFLGMGSAFVVASSVPQVANDVGADMEEMGIRTY
ncbi:hypothetical protein [Aliiroseovarius subalbicans]|uniref:hypothetical protein n=1 Tax=Aliiroseovarius subalbicans TaxID=2925840 RepID=UPI001F59A7F9|nr:hypothetical protein [Aliiroseovarius subalbicans]MCI2399036.1 hypothetical protein [Aliiroseovarius subalbicans]